MKDNVHIKKKPSVLFIGYGLHGGGAEANAVHISSYLQKKGMDVGFLLFKNINDYKQQYTSKLKNIHIFPVLGEKKLTSVERFFCSLRIFVTSIAYMHKKKHDVLCSLVEYYPVYLTVFLAHIFRKKSIVIIGDNVIEDLKRKKFLNRLIHYICLYIFFRGTSVIVCVSQGVALMIEQKFNIAKRKIQTIYNGVDSSFVTQFSKVKLTQKEAHLKRHKTMCILGRLEEKKGHEIILYSLVKVIKKIPLRLIIIGKGKLKEKLQQIVADLHIESAVSFLGFSQNPYKYIRGSDLFLFPSLYEGFGNVIVEAMALGIPTLVSDCDFGPLEIIGPNMRKNKEEGFEEHEYGMLIRLKNRDVKEKVNVLAKALLKYFSHKRLFKQYYSRMGKKRARFFSHERMAQGYYSLIKEMIR